MNCCLNLIEKSWPDRWAKLGARFGATGQNWAKLGRLDPAWLGSSIGSGRFVLTHRSARLFCLAPGSDPIRPRAPPEKKAYRFNSVTL